VPAQGFEPWTIGLKDRCSAKLSYAGGVRILPVRGLRMVPQAASPLTARPMLLL
jgi:hypothetical protein